jgi:hypothetical protein
MSEANGRASVHRKWKGNTWFQHIENGCCVHIMHSRKLCALGRCRCIASIKLALRGIGCDLNHQCSKVLCFLGLSDRLLTGIVTGCGILAQEQGRNQYD